MNNLSKRSIFLFIMIFFQLQNPFHIENENNLTNLLGLILIPI